MGLPMNGARLAQPQQATTVKEGFEHSTRPLYSDVAAAGPAALRSLDSCCSLLGTNFLLATQLEFRRYWMPMTDSSRRSGMNRRRFLATTGMAMTAPVILSSCATKKPVAKGHRTAPSERITMGIVGWGMMGPGNTAAFLGNKDCQIVAACDLDKNHLQQALDKVNG